MRAARLGLAGRLAARPARASRTVARMVVSRDMVPDVVRGARDEKLFEGVLLRCCPGVKRLDGHQGLGVSGFLS